MKRTMVLLSIVCLCLQVPTRADLISYYDFEEPNPFDDKVTGAVAAVGVNVAIESDTPFGDAGLFPDGVATDNDLRVAQADAPVIGPNDFTCMAWIKRTDGPATSADGISDMVLNTNEGGFQLLLTPNQFTLGLGGPGGNWLVHKTNGTIEDTAWHHVAVSVDRDSDQGVKMYIDGVLDVTLDATPFASVFIAANQDYQIGSTNNFNLNGSLDELAIFDTALTTAEIQKAMRGIGSPPELAAGPNPADAAVDVLRDTVLSWSSGEFAATHDVYFGTVFDDVNDASRDNPIGTLLSQDQTATTFDPGRLEFGQTYYWRIDEVNGAPDYTIFKGFVWSFTTELLAYPIENVVATSNMASSGNEGPNRLVDGSGLDEDDQHSDVVAAMWGGVPPADEPAYIQFEFDRVYKLHEMLVWNYNMSFESILGYGVKEATIEYSEDGVDWTAFGDVELTQAPGSNTYAVGDIIALDGPAAKYVRMTVHSNFGGSTTMYGLSEVRFLHIPVEASAPNPADGAVDLDVDATFSWRPGREAAVHDVYLGADPDALSMAGTATENSYGPVSLDLDATYFWRVDEVNDVETPSRWPSDVWSFSTQEYLVIDDFEAYNDDIEAGETIWQRWVDGLVEFGGDAANGGSQVGHTNSPFAELETVHGGTQSMPLYFDNTAGHSHSQATRTFAASQDWAAHGIHTLSIYVHGDAGNTAGRLYADINGTRVYYDSIGDAVGRTQWIQWPIDLTALGTDLTNVTTLSIGVEGAGASGILYVDDIRLYAKAVTTIEPVLPDENDPNLAAHYAFEGNANDSTGRYDGTIVGSPTYVGGKEGQAMFFDEVTTYVVHTFGAEEIWPAYAVSLWVKTDTFAQDQYSGVFNNNGSAADFQIDVDGADPGGYRYYGTSTAEIGPVGSDWVHLAASCDGLTTDVYYNGLFVATLDVADTTFGQIAIGVNRAMSNFFGGTIDEVRLYDRALSYGEVAGLAGLTELIPYLPF